MVSFEQMLMVVLFNINLKWLGDSEFHLVSEIVYEFFPVNPISTEASGTFPLNSVVLYFSSLICVGDK